MTRTPPTPAEYAGRIREMGDRLIELSHDLDRLYERAPAPIRAELDAMTDLESFGPQIGRDLVRLADRLEGKSPDTGRRAMHDVLTGACRGASLSGLEKGRAG